MTAKTEQDETSKNKRLVLDLHHLWNSSDMTKIATIYHPDFTAHWPASSETPTRKGLAGVRYGIERIRTAFPDWTETVLDMLEDGDRVTTRYRSTGTHKGAFWGIEPTGRTIEIDEISIYEIRDGLIYQQWCLCDELARLKQLGCEIDRTTAIPL